MPRGGKRQGTPGKTYSNRTDMGIDYSPQQGTETAAAGGQTIRNEGVQNAGQQFIRPDDIPRLDDPTARPGEPLTTGLPVGPGGGLDAKGPLPLDPNIADIRGAYLRRPTPQLERAMRIAAMKGMM